MYRLGGFFSILSSLCHLILGGLLVLQPVLFMTGKVDLFLTEMWQEPIGFVLYYLVMGLIGLFGLGLVEEVTSFLQVQENAMVKWVKKLSYLGFSVITLSYFKVITVKPYMASIYVASSEEIKEVIRTVDPFLGFATNGITTIGLIGLWIFVISLISLYNKRGSRVYSVMGLLLGCVMLSGLLPSLPPLVYLILNITQGVLSFFWFGLLGIAMVQYGRRNSINE